MRYFRDKLNRDTEEDVGSPAGKRKDVGKEVVVMPRHQTPQGRHSLLTTRTQDSDTRQSISDGDRRWDRDSDEAKQLEEISSEDSETRRNRARRENLALCCNICGFAVFLVVFTFSILAEKDLSSSQLADHVREKLSVGPVKLADIGQATDVYGYLQKSFVPIMYVNNTDTNLALTLSAYYHPLDVPNRLVGSIRVRQVRAQYLAECQVGIIFELYKTPCYPKLSPETEFTDSFGLEGKFQFKRDPLGSEYRGFFGTYSDGGYFQYLSTNVTLARLAIEGMKKDEFLGQATRAVFIDFSIWSSNTATYAVVTIEVEFSATGRVLSNIDVSILTERTLRAGGLGTGWDWLVFFSSIIVLLFVAYYLYEEFQEFWGSKLDYFTDAWNVLDWINMVLIIIGFVLRVLNFSAASSLNVGQGALKNPDSFANLRSMATTQELVQQLQAFNSVIMWLKCAKYLRHIPVVKTFIRAIWSALQFFGPFIVMFAFVFVGFAIAYNVGLGVYIEELSTFGKSLIFLARTYLKDVSLAAAFDIAPIFCAIMVLLFYIALVLIGITFICAIIADALFVAKNKKKKRFYEKENEVEEDEPVEELVRVVKAAGLNIASRVLPRRMRKYILPAGLLRLRNDSKSDSGFRSEGSRSRMLMDADSQFGGQSNEGSIYSEDFVSDQGQVLREDLCFAIEYMSGRVLSEISILGIEVKSELHDVCERVAQMQMAVNELVWRTEQIRLEQEDVLERTR